MPLPPIALAQPIFHLNERAYVNDVLDTTRLSMGPYVARLERQFAQQTDRRHAIACSSGTAALHLALLAAGVGADGLVLMPALSYVATANAATYCGARPLFVDIDPSTWQMDLDAAKRALVQHGRRVQAIVAVDLYGGMGPMPAYQALAEAAGVPLIVDAAESIGATSYGSPAGSFGEAAIFSLFGNKTITCGEGGIVVTNSDRLAEWIRLYRGQGQTPGRPYWHEVVGYNYRLTDLQAALAVAQMEHLAWHVGARRRVAMLYAAQLPAAVQMQLHDHGTRSAHWMQVVVLPNGAYRDVVRDHMASLGIETRPTFVPLHLLPPYQTAPRLECPEAERVGRSGICLPTHAGLTAEDVARVADALRTAMDGLV